MGVRLLSPAPIQSKEFTLKLYGKVKSVSQEIGSYSWKNEGEKEWHSVRLEPYFQNVIELWSIENFGYHGINPIATFAIQTKNAMTPGAELILTIEEKDVVQ